MTTPSKAGVRVRKECAGCEKPFEVYPSEADSRKYCSLKCRDAAYKGVSKGGQCRIEKTCPTCGKRFVNLDYARAIYCSIKCAGKANATHARVDRAHCLNCGAAFKPVNFDQSLCSRKCVGEYQTQQAIARYEKLIHEPLEGFLRRKYRDPKVFVSEIQEALGIQVSALYALLRRYDIPIGRRAQSAKEHTRRIQKSGEWQTRVAKLHKGSKHWHEENKDYMRAHGAKTYMEIVKRRRPTSIEKAMKQALDTAGVAYQFQYPISNRQGVVFVCDFGFPPSNLIVECDGEYWHGLAHNQKRDAHKDAYLKAAHYRLIRFSEKQIKSDIHSCVDTIRKALAT